MTITDQIKMLNKNVKQNEAQYDLDKKAGKISALSSNNLDKYEYLTGLFKRLKNIENAQKSLTKDESKKKLEPIRNEEQSEVLEDKLTVVDKKPKEIVLLKDKLDFIFKNLTRILIVLEKKLIIVICFLKQVISLLLKVVVF